MPNDLGTYTSLRQHRTKWAPHVESGVGAPTIERPSLDERHWRAGRAGHKPVAVWGLFIASLSLITIIPESTIYGRMSHAWLQVSLWDKVAMVAIAGFALPNALRHGVPLRACIFWIYALLVGAIAAMTSGIGYKELFGTLLLVGSGALAGAALAADPDRTLLPRLLLFAGLVSTLATTLQWITGSSFPYSESGALRGFYDLAGSRVVRAPGLLGEPLAVASILMVAFFASFGSGLSRKTAWAMRAALVVGLILTFSRGSLFALVIAAVAGIVSLRGLTAGRRLGAILAAATAVALMLALFPDLWSRVSRFDDLSYSFRYSVVSRLPTAFADGNLGMFGTGPRGYLDVRAFFEGPADNGYIGLVASWGLLGAAAYLAPAISVLARDRARTWASCAVLSMLLNGVTYEFTEYSSVGFLFVLLSTWAWRSGQSPTNSVHHAGIADQPATAR